MSAQANSCLNIQSDGLYDRPVLEVHPSDGSIVATGTFRIEDVKNEDSQPDFNLTQILCHRDNSNAVLCRVVLASVEATADAPGTTTPNCKLSLDETLYEMKEFSNGLYIGIEPGVGTCFDTLLTINLKTRRVSMSFNKSADADNISAKTAKIFKNICKLPATRVLMNCTMWAKFRHDPAKGQQETDARYCDFSSASDMPR